MNIKCTHVEVNYQQLEKFQNRDDIQMTLNMMNDNLLLLQYHIPCHVCNIANSCFYLYENLSEIILPSTLTSICEEAFYNCVSLHNIQFPESLKSIGSLAFSGCGLTQVSIPTTVTYIGNNAFSECYKLKSACIPESGLECYMLLNYCFNLTTVNILKSNKKCFKINGAFNGCYSLKEIAIPESIVALEKSSFKNCSSLNKITIGNCVEKIGSNCFENCERLEYVKIPNLVTLIDTLAFKNCTKLRRVTFTNPIKTISPTAFEECTNLCEIYIGIEKIKIVEFLVSYNVSCMLENKSMICNNIIFVQSDFKKHLKLYKENGKNIGEIPNKVVRLSEQCFRTYKEVDIIKVPKSVKKVDDFCFYNSIPIENIIFEEKESIKISELAFGFDNC
ncbi:hypothetical protein EIN_437660 [Entamoeba invadens IP1]|uniref:Leucine rich repeat containing protein BspA family protein n=1 Tax=Entamoeba invadens IP1 TaxID=370355 RepID=A0A0A1U717_ENTIV|nr:hypothetical protein EIN_437660 [Entamoeba invadens IP1]ELP88786.1 hypothetical protein EIN_437660 [Entamoeba invadens IP1]|eukprot:XP_004255557.1 hypothetical protein EIN_437660 [Entamoeba invadens IP1]